jgi:hypothetical protein
MTTSNLTLSRVGYAERIENIAPRTLLRMALDGQGLEPTAAEVLLGITAGDIAAQILELATKGYVSFVRTGNCTTNDAVTLELMARGVTAAASTVRRIEIQAHSIDDAGLASYERRFIVEGAATPVLGTFGGAAAVETTIETATGGASTAIDYTRTVQVGTEPQTFAFAAGAGTLTFTYTGQTGDVTNFRFEIRVFPKIALTFE